MPHRLDDEDTFTIPARRVLVRQRPNMKRPKAKSSGLDETILDRHSVSLLDLEQIIDPGQTGTVVRTMRTILEGLTNSQVALPDLLECFQRCLGSERLDTTAKVGTRTYPAFLVRPRMVNISVALDHYQGLRIQQGRSAERTSPAKDYMLVGDV